jgi:para-nitrobenzyl esterase
VEQGSVVVQTAHGKLEGWREDGLDSFRGIPYGRAPIGDLRFRPPLASEPWLGVRSALRYGPSAPQNESSIRLMAVGEQSEDCLYLNVETPRADDARRPVFVWVHGGAFVEGSGSQLLYRGSALARRCDVVVVTLNYRLGLLGYGYLEEAGGAEIGAVPNLGQLDQVAALEWVRDNIAAFGGDPQNVTIAGESAGSIAVTVLLSMPAAAGLFHRAIAQSGVAYRIGRPDAGTETAHVILRELGLVPGSIGALRQIPVEDLLRAQTALGSRSFQMRTGFWPVQDGTVIPTRPLDAVRDGRFARVPLLLGSNRDETRIGRQAPIDGEQLERAVRSMLGRRGDAAPRLIDVYRKSRERRLPSSNADLQQAIATDHRFRIPVLRFAEAHAGRGLPTFVYLFCWDGSVVQAATHGLEIPFVFGTHDLPEVRGFAGDGLEAAWLASEMMDSWGSFLRCGDPARRLDWRPYTLERRETMLFDRHSELVAAPYEDERAAWDDLLP